MSGYSVMDFVETLTSTYLAGEQIKSSKDIVALDSEKKLLEWQLANKNRTDDYSTVKTGENSNGSTLVGSTGAQIVNGFSNTTLFIGVAVVGLAAAFMLSRESN